MDIRGGDFQIALEVRFILFLSIPWNISVKSGVHLRVSKNL